MKKIVLLTLIVFQVSLSFGQNDKSDLRNELGLSFSTTRNVSASYKLGVQKWYGILDIGTNFKEADAPILGIGAGHAFVLNDASSINVEAMFTAYLYDNFNADFIDKGFELSALYEYDLSDRFGLIGGLTYSIIENHSQMGYDTKSLIKSIRKEEIGNTKAGHFVGAKIGVYYKF